MESPPRQHQTNTLQTKMQWPDGDWTSPCPGDYGCKAYATISHGLATLRQGPTADGCTESWASYLSYQGGFVTFTPAEACTAYPSFTCACETSVETASFKYVDGVVYIGDGTAWSRLQPPPPPPQSASDQLALIIGVSVAGLVAILVLIGVMLWQRRKKNHAIEVPPLHVPIMHPVVIV